MAGLDTMIIIPGCRHGAGVVPSHGHTVRYGVMNGGLPGVLVRHGHGDRRTDGVGVTAHLGLGALPTDGVGAGGPA